MISNFFLLEGRGYLNNAIVIADLLSVINNQFGDVKNLNIKFKKPYNSQADLTFSTEPLEGYTLGSFDTFAGKYYFAYNPVPMPLLDKVINTEVVDYFNLSYEITDIGRGRVTESFENVFGPMSKTDKVIFAICDIVDTMNLNKLIKNNQKPKITVSKAEHIGNRRFKYSVLLDDVIFSYRYCSVKEFNI